MIDSYHLYISETRLLLRRESGFLWWRSVHAHGEWRWDAAMPSSLNLENVVLKKKLRSKLHVYVGSGLCKFMMVGLPPGLKNVEEERAAAQAQVHHQLGLVASEWRCAVDVVVAPNKSVVCAVRSSLLERIQNLSDEYGFRLVSFKPFVAGIWNAALEMRLPQASGESVLMVVENNAFTILVDRTGVVESISALSHNSEPDLVEREIRRVGLSLGSGAAASVRLAVSPEVRDLVQAHAPRVLQKGATGAPTLYADFRDLFFDPAVEELL